MFYTTDEAAALLHERGYKGYKGTPITADAVKRMCYRGKFPHAKVEHRGPGRGYWLIPETDLNALLASRSPAPR